MPWVIGAVCCAEAMAVELSDRTFNAAARLTGAATLALTRLIASRSGSSATCSVSNSSALSSRADCGCGLRSLVMIEPPLAGARAAEAGGALRAAPCRLDALDDGRVLLRQRGRRRVVREHVGRDRRIDRRRQVGIDETHRLAVGEFGHLFLRQLVGR